MSDLATGLRALDDAAPRVIEAKEHYEGTAPEVFSSRGVARYLRGTGQKFRLNWCRVVVTAVLNRLELAAVQAVSTTEDEDPTPGEGEPNRAQATLDALWYANRMGLQVRNLHEAALSQGETFAIVWPGADGRPRIYHNPPTQVQLVYDPEDGETKRFAVKRWLIDTGRMRVNLYYADRIERYISANPVREDVNPEDLIPYFDEGEDEDEDDWVVPNEYGEIPVFHFRPQWPDARPEHLDAYGAQNGLNKLLASYYGTVDFQVFPQRYALSDGGTAGTTMADEDFADDEPAPNREKEQPQAGAGTVWWLDNAKAVGQFAPADPKVFWDPVQQLVQHLAVTTDTPFHLFQFGGQPPSGESRRAASEPLYAKTANRQLSLGATWEELWGFVLRVAGVGGSVQVDWAPIDKADDKDGLEAAEKKRALGVPDDVVLMEVGYTDREMAAWAPDTLQADSPPEGDTP